MLVDIFILGTRFLTPNFIELFMFYEIDLNISSGSPRSISFLNLKI